MKTTKIIILAVVAVMITTILAIAVLTAGYLFGREKQEITNATIYDDITDKYTYNILEVNFKFWVKGNTYSPDAIDYLSWLDIYLNDKKIDFNWQQYPQELTQKNEYRRVIRGGYWGLSNYDDDALYYWSDVSTGYSSSAAFQFQQPTYIKMQFLLENTTIQRPIKIELRKNKRTIDSTIVE